MPTRVNFIGTKATPVGNSRTIHVTAQRADGSAFNLAGCSFKFTLRYASESAPVCVKATGTAYQNSDPSHFTVTDEAGGGIDINLHATDTRGAKPGIPLHDLEITEPDGSVTTIIVGNFELSDHAGR
jgi:hypothetical protein